MVPLLTWSSTIRHAGETVQEKLHQEGKFERLLVRLEEQTLGRALQLDFRDKKQVTILQAFHRRCKRLESRKKRREKGSAKLKGAARTILLIWGCLVAMGLGCVYAAVIDPTSDARYGHWLWLAHSQANEIRCTPENGTLDITAGQNSQWPTFLVTSEFLNVNNCIDPCPNFSTEGGSVPFRVDSDLQSVTENQRFLIDGGGLTSNERRKWEFMTTYGFQLSWIGVYLVLQWIWAACFGRSQPSEARIRTYSFITRLRIGKTGGGSKPSKLRARLAKVVAFVTYFGAVGIAIVTVPLLVMNVTVIELYIGFLPQSEPAVHIGAWAPYGSTGLTLFSFFIAHEYTSHVLNETLHRVRRLGKILACWRTERHRLAIDLRVCKHSLQNFWLKLYTNLMDYCLEQKNDLVDVLQYEWTYTRRFWRDSDDELAKFQARKKEIAKMTEAMAESNEVLSCP